MLDAPTGVCERPASDATAVRVAVSVVCADLLVCMAGETSPVTVAELEFDCALSALSALVPRLGRLPGKLDVEEKSSRRASS
jgi:hypothetical protein